MIGPRRTEFRDKFSARLHPEADSSERPGASELAPSTDGRLRDQVRLPNERQGEVIALLEPGERLLAWFAPDLDAQLNFTEGLVVLTDRRVLYPIIRIRPRV